VAVLDADKEGFLRSTSALIQTFGRAARNVNGKVLLYAEVVTDSMKAAIAETTRRRALQEDYNRANGITPQSIVKSIDELLTSVYERDYFDYTKIAEEKEFYLSPQQRQQKLDQLGKLMKAAAKGQDYEKAAQLRDQIAKIKTIQLEIEEP
jgi:excinuclease ABC subunit B